MLTLNFQRELTNISRQMGLVGPLVGGIVGGLGVTSASVASSLWQRCKISNHYKKCGIWCTSLNAFNYKRAEISNVPAVLHLHILVPFFSFSFQDFKLFRDLFKYALKSPNQRPTQKLHAFLLYQTRVCSLKTGVNYLFQHQNVSLCQLHVIPTKQQMVHNLLA